MMTRIEYLQVTASRDEFLEVKSSISERNRHKQYAEVQQSAADNSDTVSYPIKIKNRFWSSGLAIEERLNVKLYSRNTHQTIEVRTIEPK